MDRAREPSLAEVEVIQISVWRSKPQGSISLETTPGVIYPSKIHSGISRSRSQVDNQSPASFAAALPVSW